MFRCCPRISAAKNCGSLTRDMKMSGWRLRYLYREVVPHFGPPTIKKFGRGDVKLTSATGLCIATKRVKQQERNTSVRMLPTLSSWCDHALLVVRPNELGVPQPAWGMDLGA